MSTQSIKEQSNTQTISIFDPQEDKKLELKKFQKNQVCAECKSWIIRQKSIGCGICEDVYHLFCMRPKLTRKPKKWTCTRCLELKNTFPDTNELEIDTLCGRCQKQVSIDDEEFCSKCSKVFHRKCYGPKKVAPICIFCEQSKPPKIKSNKNLVQFLPLKISLKKQKSFILPCCIYDDTLREKCFNSIQYALYCQNICFNDDLVYESVQKLENNVSHEKLEPLIGKDLEAFKKYKQVTKHGYYAPVIVEYNIDQGFYVKAVQPIVNNTLICEYAGEVFRFADQVYSTSDSMMSLLETNFAATSLVIIPQKYGNLAKYLSGINNTKKNSKKQQQNVKSQRFNVEGESRVILYACREIRTGEVLYYDYNEGGFNYNTRFFV
ncbi:unnamed protein product [Paramecium pentaurelia]|uniref:SET domain-containing protein n=1 Tax=Paramecium pentaurelia TaxID=43138 RepID=A0A8S1X279_9CILI|nr:unnamed protein product [Paramecium pentaurelia]